MKHDLLYQALKGRKKPCREIVKVSRALKTYYLTLKKKCSYSVYAITVLAAKRNFKMLIFLFFPPL